jgi:hypothetical protein
LAGSRRKGSGFLKSTGTFFFKKTGSKLSLYVFLLFNEYVIGLKKLATLLPNYWLAKTPQTLASRRLGRQSAERERISEINWNVFFKKTAAKLDFHWVWLQFS